MEISDTAVFHPGERAVQERLGVRGKMAQIGGRVIRDHMPDPHRTFFAQLPFIVIGALDAQRQPWATALAGPPGFISSPDPKRLLIDAPLPPNGLLAAVLAAGSAVGLLGIEPHTRRRNRMNGIVETVGARGIGIAVSQSFGNCPKYIQARRPEFTGAATPDAPLRRTRQLDAAAQFRVRGADTLFIATAHPAAVGDRDPAHGVDVSHRGGRPGFVRVEREGTRLTLPDFVGNDYFNTIGNLELNPGAGLLFIDFTSGDLLHVAVRGTVIWDGPQVRAFEGAQRLLQFDVLECRSLDAGLPLRWGPPEISPFLRGTGRWDPA